MESIDGSEYILRKLLDFDKLCFNYCIKVPEKKFTTKDEVCLKNCTTKVLNALEYLKGLNDQGGIDRINLSSKQKW